MFMSHMKTEAVVPKTEEELAKEEEERIEMLEMEERLNKIAMAEKLANAEGEEELEGEGEVHDDDRNDDEHHDDDEEDLMHAAALASNTAVLNFANMFANIKVNKKIEERPRRTINRDTSNLEKIKRAEYGLNIKQLRGWKAERMVELQKNEVSRQEIAVSKVSSFMDAIGENYFICTQHHTHCYAHYYTRIATYTSLHTNHNIPIYRYTYPFLH